MRVGLRIRQIVEGHNLKFVGVSLEHSAKSLAPNPAKSVDTNTSRHNTLLLLNVFLHTERNIFDGPATCKIRTPVHLASGSSAYE